MIKSIVLILFSFVTLSALSQSEIERITIAFDNDYYPYSWVDESGQLQGFLVDWWQLWSIETDVEVKPITAGKKELVQKLKKKEVDVISGYYSNEEILNEFHAGDVIIRLRTTLFVKNHFEAMYTKSSFLKIGVVENDLTQRYLEKNHPNLTLELYDNFSELKGSIENEAIDAFVYDVPSSLETKNANPHPDGYKFGERLYSKGLRPLVRREDSKLMELINDGADDIPDAKLIKLDIRWSMFNDDEESSFWFIVIILTSLFSLSISFFLIRRKKPKHLSINDINYFIKNGENEFVEFKSSMWWDFRENKLNKALEINITKTVAAFANSKGGVLIIGLSDEGVCLGLQHDYNNMSKKNADGFLLALSNVIRRDIGPSFIRNFFVSIIAFEGNEVCLVKVKKSKRPVFVKTKGKTQFYIRSAASTEPLNVKEATNYINDHWR